MKHLIKQWHKDITIEAGFFYVDMPEEEYHNHKAVSRSDFKTLITNPLAFKHKPEIKRTPAMEFGTAFHCMMLEPKKFKANYYLAENIENRRCKEYKEKLEYFDADKILIGNDVKKLIGMRNALQENKAVQEILYSDGYAEVSAFCEDKNGIMYKARFDYLTSDSVALDLKTTCTASDEYLSRDINNKFYHLQNYFYEFVYTNITKKKLKSFVFAFIEKEEPFLINPVVISIEYYNLGLMAFQDAQDTYKRYLQDNAIINNNKHITILEPPVWLTRGENAL